jgi:sortase B
MKKRVSGLEVAAKISHGISRILNIVIAISLVVACLYSGYALWDNWQIYNGAKLDSDLLKYKPNTDGDYSGLTLSELQKINPDVCAWLTVDGTNIDYPVVQGEDNFTYINKDVYGEFSLSGSVFLDYHNNRDFSDFYSLLYAHHMEGNVMFGEVPNFLEKDYFEEHTSGTLYLVDGSMYEIEWFASFTTNAYDSKVFYAVGENGDALKDAVLDYVKQKAVQYREVGVTTSDQIIGLSTCFSDNTDGRSILFGRMSKKK